MVDAFKMHILILAGGGGTRLWPLSREDFPKQFLHFGDQQSLLQKSVNRFLHSPLTETISIATNAQYAPLVRQQLETIDPDGKIHLIIEPARKNTAPAIAFAMKVLQTQLKVAEEAPILILPSDHLIEPQAVFSSYLMQIAPLIQDDHLVLFGIRPTKPETGYGYIQRGEPFDSVVHHVKRFVEKPDHKLAESYVASGEYLWNSGIFVLSIRLFWQKISQHAVQIKALMQGNLEEVISRFNEMPSISFDYAILEKCDDILVCQIPVIWSDVGCWDSVYDIMDKDENQNVKYGNIIDIDTKNSLIIGGKRLISIIGLEDVLIVETDDATFISKKGESQKVKNMVQELVKSSKKEPCSWGTLQLLDETKEYSVQKVQINPGETWESHTSGKWLLLDSFCKLEINGDLQSFVPFDSHPIQKGQKMKNLSEKIANLLLCGRIRE